MEIIPDYPSDTSQEVVVPAKGLQKVLAEILEKKGMFRVEAEIGAARLVEADLRGIQSHGSRALPRYIEAMDRGEIDPRAQIITERETPAMAVLNGGAGLGHVAATKGMQLAIQKAKEVGTGTVAVKRGQHYGAAGVYALMAVEAGVIGYTTTNTGPATVAAYGSRQPAVANNAFAWGVPLPEGPPFIFDAACAVASWGKVHSLKMYGQKLPAGWALDENGNETTDPSAAKTLLPFSGPRGYGMAFLSSVLAGPLVAARMPIKKTWSISSDCSEHFFYAIDITHFVEPEKYDRQLQIAVEEIRALEPCDGFDTVRLPGEPEWELAERRKTEGIPIHKDHAKDLQNLAAELKVEWPW